jgi:hypothetical protein
MTPLSWALLACTEPEPVPQPSAPAQPPVTSPGAPWVLPEQDGDEQEIDLDLLVARAEEAIALVPRIEPDPVLEVYRALAVGADGACPTRYTDGDLQYWLDSCVSGAGTRFDGFGVDDEATLDEDGLLYDFAATGGTARIEDDQGTWLELDGFVQRIDSEQGGVLSSTMVLAGSFATNHPAAAGTWLEQGLRPSFVTTAYDVGGIRAAFSVVGAVDGLPGEYTAVAFDGCGVIDETLGYGGCAAEPSGTVSLRLPSGGWVDIVFDPVAAESITIEDPAACDGCGRAWYRERDLGPVCLDFSSWLP